MGSKSVFLKKRTEGTERADKAAPERGVEKFFGDMPSWELYETPAPVDVVVVPAIDGNFDPSTDEMIPFERQFQTLHSLQNYFLLNELLAPGLPMPIVDTEALRRAARRVRRAVRGPARTTSSGRRRRRCCSTKSTGSSRAGCARSSTTGRPASAEAIALLDRARAGGARRWPAAPT